MLQEEDQPKVNLNVSYSLVKQNLYTCLSNVLKRVIICKLINKKLLYFLLAHFTNV